MILYKEDIDFDVDYEDLAFLESTFMHDKNRLGEVGVVEKYRSLMDSIEFGSDVARRYLIGFINYFANKNNLEVISDTPKVFKYVLNPYDFGLIQLGVMDFSDIDMENCIQEFLQQGILKYEIQGAV